MKNKRVMFFILALLALVAILSAVHLNTRDTAVQGTVQVSYNEENFVLDYNKWQYKQVSGIRINGKGDEILVEGKGIELDEILKQLEIIHYRNVIVSSDDSYTAEVSAEEAGESGKVYLMYEKDAIRLIVFGDTDSKRSVSNVVRITVE
ncbi:hypothetical protein [Qiania dongpingensis]|uniref:Uncharacterized protein n=1 Tax=Qiania dongpingensis TaxID=2763669 RepID=A0A7G9G3N6_9FIRM|nr:hypothetical protein [Qiania dongpingensis]QNM05418.1 hypothetical protein H9Q78_13450 [Qiania dongpingensis]